MSVYSYDVEKLSIAIYKWPSSVMEGFPPAPISRRCFVQSPAYVPEAQGHPVAVAIANLSSMSTAQVVRVGSWPSLEPLRTTPEFPRELQADAGELDNPISLSWHGLAVRLTRRPRQRGQHHPPTGSVLGRLDQELLERDINVDIVEFEVEGGLHVGRADEARRGVVLPSHSPQFLAFGEGHLQPSVAAGNGAFDLDLSGHFPNITTIAQGGGAQGIQGQRLSWLRSGKVSAPK